MSETKIDVKIMDEIMAFIAEVSKYYTIDAVYLFGSYAKGKNSKWSDIDLAIISKDINNRIDDMAKLFLIASKFDANIEPHPFKTELFNSDEYIIADEILRTGIRVA